MSGRSAIGDVQSLSIEVDGDAFYSLGEVKGTSSSVDVDDSTSYADVDELDTVAIVVEV